MPRGGKLRDGRPALCMADHIFVTSFLSGEPANTGQYSVILLGQSDLRRPEKNYISLTDQARLYSSRRGRASGEKVYFLTQNGESWRQIPRF